MTKVIVEVAKLLRIAVHDPIMVEHASFKRLELI
jgi:DNA repair protein RadC